MLRLLALLLALAPLPALAGLAQDLDALPENGFIGIAAGLADDRAILDMAARGLREKGQAAPVTTGDLWHLGSITKSMTMLTLGTLVAEGRLDVDSPLPDLLPDIAGMDAGWQAVTLRDVLEHRAGLPVNFGPRVMLDKAETLAERPAKRAEALRGILAKPPGERVFRYSNVDYTLAGHVVENLTGKPWEQAVTERVFTPIGLQSAGFGAPKGAGRYDQPVGHANFLGLYLKPMNPFDSAADNSPIIGPAGTVHMSLPDLLHYGQALLRMEQGQDDLLPAAVFHDLTTPRTGEYAGGLITGDYAPAGGRFLWHNGSNTMWYAMLVILPEKTRVIAVTVNQEGPATRDMVWQLVARIAARPTQN